jgi:hypothetical protein
MKLNPAWMLLLLSFCLFDGGTYSSEMEREGSESDPDPAHRIIESATAKERGKKYRAYFDNIGAEKLGELKKASNAGIALQSFWEMGKRLSHQGDLFFFQRFIGFLEGRTRLSIPLRWEFQLTSCFLRSQPKKAKTAFEVYLPKCSFLKKSKNGSFTYQPEILHKTALGFKTAKNVEIGNEKGGAFLTIGKKRIGVAKNFFNQKGLSYWDKCAGHIGQDYTFVAFYNSIAESFPLFCLDSKSGKVLWKKTVWAEGGLIGGKTGAYFHDLSLEVSENHIGVFGLGGECYLEIFDSKKGDAICRFSTNLWGHDKK